MSLHFQANLIPARSRRHVPERMVIDLRDRLHADGETDLATQIDELHRELESSSEDDIGGSSSNRSSRSNSIISYERLESGIYAIKSMTGYDENLGSIRGSMESLDSAVSSEAADTDRPNVVNTRPSELGEMSTEQSFIDSGELKLDHINTQDSQSEEISTHSDVCTSEDLSQREKQSKLLSQNSLSSLDEESISVVCDRNLVPTVDKTLPRNFSENSLTSDSDISMSNEIVFSKKGQLKKRKDTNAKIISSKTSKLHVKTDEKVLSKVETENLKETKCSPTDSGFYSEELMTNNSDTIQENTTHCDLSSHLDADRSFKVKAENIAEELTSGAPDVNKQLSVETSQKDKDSEMNLHDGQYEKPVEIKGEAIDEKPASNNSTSSHQVEPFSHQQNQSKFYILGTMKDR